MKSGINFNQNVHYRVYDREGKLKDDKWTHNQPQDAVLEYVIDALDTGTTFAVDTMAIGTGSGQSTSDTALSSLSSYETTANTQSGTPEDDIEFSATFTAKGSWAIEEAGLFVKADATASMVFYDDSISTSMTDGDTLQIDWTVSVASA